MHNEVIDTYAVMGNPIAHSKSPFIHSEFAKQTHQQLRYIAILAPLENFPAAVADFQLQGGKGFNITVPFKQQAFALVNQLSARAELAAAVNTIKIQTDNILFGDNTDGVGLIRDIVLNQQYSLQNKRILLLGAGGAVRGVLAPLLAENPKLLIVANRTKLRAEELAEKFSKLGAIQACGLDDLAKEKFDLIINGTSASLSDQLPSLPDNLLAADGWCYDMAYGNKPTAFQQWANQQGASKAIDGLGMLVEQAAEAFYVWRGIKPQTKPVIDLLRMKL